MTSEELRAAAERLKDSAAAWLENADPDERDDRDHIAHWRDQLACAKAVLADPPPIDMVLPCPRCGVLHVDAPEPEKDWSNPPHKSHLCKIEDGGCGLVWRPADVPTNGAAAVKTRGARDGTAAWTDPVTPERLPALGFRLFGKFPEVLAIGPTYKGPRLNYFAPGPYAKYEWTYVDEDGDSVSVPPPKTMGDLWRLCRALGIELKETT